MIDDKGQRLEGDVRKSVKERVREMYWEKAAGGASWKRWHNMGERQKAYLKKCMKSGVREVPKRHIVAAFGERMGFKTEYGMDSTCRICVNDCVHNQGRRGEKGKVRLRDGGCRHCTEDLDHVLKGNCNVRK